MTRHYLLVAVVIALLPNSSRAQSNWRLIGITGNQGVAIDETLYELDVASTTITPIIKLPFVPDTDSIGFNPLNGLLYRVSGATSYSNNPASNGYRDNYFMQTVDVLSGSLAQTVIFNNNSEQFGTAGPKPPWAVPTQRRTDAQTSSSFQIVAPNEYHSLRDITWSASDCLFYGADELGIFKMTPSGTPTFVGNPGGQPKGITFATINGERKLFLSDRDGPELWTIDPLTGQHIGAPVMVRHPANPETFVDGLLSIVQVPDLDVLVGIRKTDGAPNNRDLITINPVTGFSEFIMALGVNMADLAVIYEPTVGDLNGDGSIGRTDVAMMMGAYGRGSGATAAMGDFNCDGRVSASDLVTLQGNLDPISADSPAPSAAIPEPSTLCMAVVGLALVAAAGRRIRSGH